VKAPRFEVGYMGTAVALVEAGLGVCVLPARAAALIRSRTAVFRPLRNPVVSRAATLVTRADRSLSPAAAAFVTFLSDKKLAAYDG
jgi:DNA-binding transcriptional LysR family regulator